MIDPTRLPCHIEFIVFQCYLIHSKEFPGRGIPAQQKLERNPPT